MVISPLHQSNEILTIATNCSELKNFKPYVFNYTKQKLSDNWGLVIDVGNDGSMVVDEILTNGIIDQHHNLHQNSLQIGDLIISVNGNIIPVQLARFKSLMKTTEVQLIILRYQELTSQK